MKRHKEEMGNTAHQDLRRPELPVQPSPGRCGRETAAEGVGNCWALSVRLHSLHCITRIVRRTCGAQQAILKTFD